MSTYTSATNKVLSHAFLAGWAPRSDIAPQRGARRVLLDAAQGPDSPFGVVYVGARSGRILRATLHRGSFRPAIVTTGMKHTRTELRRLIFRWHASQPRRSRTR